MKQTTRFLASIISFLLLVNGVLLFATNETSTASRSAQIAAVFAVITSIFAFLVLLKQREKSKEQET